jgi:hypothetical protein
LPAAEALAYATACLEREALELARQMELFLLPAETFAGSRQIHERLQDGVRSMLGLRAHQAVDPREAAGVAEVERELTELYPWYSDPERLNRVWRSYGKLGRQMFPV